MKNMKKIIVLLLTLAMVMGLGMTAFADETTPHKITITNETNGHTYEAYQVFAGTLSDGKLIKITWGSGVNGEALLTELKTKEAYNTCENATDVANILEGFSSDSAEIDAFAAIVGKHLATVSGTSTVSAEASNGKYTYTINVTGDGYYFIKDKDGSVTGTGDAYTKYMLKVVGDIEVVAKDGTTTSVKKVDDTNDSTDSPNEIIWHDSADHDIRDYVPFKIDTTIAEDYGSYSTYKLVIHDQQSAGLTFNADSVEVYVDNSTTPVDKSLYQVETNCEDKCTFEIVFADLTKITNVKAGSIIAVKYTSTLNENAIIGSLGNPNKMYAEYSNNPNGEGTGITEEDTVIVFTYKTIVNKVNEEDEPLKGAEFTLSKKLANGTWKSIESVDGTELTTFEFIGLDDGLYKLEETKTPAGYNTAAPIYFKVVATHDEDSAIPELTSLKVYLVNEEGKYLDEDGKVVESAEQAATGLFEIGTLEYDGKTSSNATITTNVENKSGATLPETGGMGTTIFYVIGTILVLGAGIVLVTRRRMSN